MTPIEFKQQWTEGEFVTVPIPRERTAELGLAEPARTFFAESGLPEDAAPFLNFLPDSEDAPRRMVRLPEQFRFLDAAFAKYIAIGSDGGGNPVVINTARADCVEWLDHENDFTATYMNASVESLAACLLAYRTFIKTLLAQNGGDAYLQADFSDEHLNALKKGFEQADPRALREGFWKAELEQLLANREANKKAATPWWKFW